MSGFIFTRGSVYAVWGFIPPPTKGSPAVIVRDPTGYANGPHGFMFHKGNDQTLCAAMPTWLLAVPFGVCAGLFFHRYRVRRRREMTGMCRQCGYDLRASPERCPECGTSVQHFA